MSIEDFTNESGINNEMISKDSLLSDYKFTEALSFDQEYEGVPGGNVLFGGMQVRKKKYTDDTAGIWLGVDSDGVAKLYIGNTTNSVKWSGSALTLVGAITASSGTIGGWIIGSGSLSSAASGERIVLNSTDKKIQLFNASASEVTTLFYGTGTTNALLKLAPTNDARRALEIVTVTGLGADAKCITIDNPSESITIDITDAGLTGINLAGASQSGIIITHAGTDSALEITCTSDLPAVEIAANGTGANSYGIRLTRNTTSLKDGVLFDINSDSAVPKGMYIDIDMSSTSATPGIGLQVDSNNADTGGADGIVVNAKSAAIRVDSATIGVDTSPIGNTNASFKIAQDDTSITTSTTDSTGRIKINVAGATRYIPYFT